MLTGCEQKSPSPITCQSRTCRNQTLKREVEILSVKGGVEPHGHQPLCLFTALSFTGVSRRRRLQSDCRLLLFLYIIPWCWCCRGCWCANSSGQSTATVDIVMPYHLQKSSYLGSLPPCPSKYSAAAPSLTLQVSMQTMVFMANWGFSGANILLRWSPW